MKKSNTVFAILVFSMASLFGTEKTYTFWMRKDNQLFHTVDDVKAVDVMKQADQKDVYVSKEIKINPRHLYARLVKLNINPLEVDIFRFEDDKIILSHINNIYILDKGHYALVKKIGTKTYIKVTLSQVTSNGTKELKKFSNVVIHPNTTFHELLIDCLYHYEKKIDRNRFDYVDFKYTDQDGKDAYPNMQKNMKIYNLALSEKEFTLVVSENLDSDALFFTNCWWGIVTIIVAIVCIVVTATFKRWASKLGLISAQQE
ncbi:MAG: hypothetical protein AAF770_03880 [Bacteroidota bacterium]